MNTSDDFSPLAGDLKVQAKESVRGVGHQLHEQANHLRDATAAIRYNTQDFIENNPWESVAIAAGIGFLLGVVFTRR